MLPATWGRLETTPSATAGPVQFVWPSLAASAVPPGVTVQASATMLEGGGTHITIDVSPVACPFDVGGYARLAAAVRALDSWDNASGFAVARAERVDRSRSEEHTSELQSLRHL